MYHHTHTSSKYIFLYFGYISVPLMNHIAMTEFILIFVKISRISEKKSTNGKLSIN
jgi:hypothetical protein